MSNPRVAFAPSSTDPFALDLQSRVRAYFANSGGNQHANALMIAKTIFYLAGYIGLYAWILLRVDPSWATLGLCAALGCFSAGIGFNIGHDAIHGAYSSSRRVNRILGHSFSLIGAHVHNWKILHNVLHHSYTNIVGADGDLHPISWLRFHTSPQGLRPYHRFQHLYAPFLYALTSLVWAVQKDFVHIRKSVHLSYEKPLPPAGEFRRLILTKAAYFAVFLLGPWLAGYSVGQVVLGFLVLHAAQGLMLAFTFQLGHIVEGPQVTEVGTVLPSWQRVQLAGTSNFAPGNALVNWVCGGLNYQIEHHLFPQVCHVHYPQLSKIVEETAKQHGLQYHTQPSLSSALRSHFRVLKRAGRPLEDHDRIEEPCPI